jgi:hypothetical protein
LNFVTGFSAQSLELLTAFNAFRSRGHPQASAQANYGAHDRNTVFIFRQAVDEASIKLDLVEWKLPQIAERRVPCFEIVQRIRDAYRSRKDMAKAKTPPGAGSSIAPSALTRF